MMKVIGSLLVSFVTLNIFAERITAQEFVNLEIKVIPTGSVQTITIRTDSVAPPPPITVDLSSSNSFTKLEVPLISGSWITDVNISTQSSEKDIYD